MKKLFIILSSVVSVASFAVTSLVETSGGPDTHAVVMNLDASILTGDVTAAPGVTFGVANRISSTAPLYIGGELGAYVATGTPSYAIFPLMGEVYYQFEPAAIIHPLLGVMIGPVFSTSSYVSSVRMGMIFRPGVNFELGKMAVLNVEPRFGVLGSAFVFAPQIGAIFPM